MAKSRARRTCLALGNSRWIVIAFSCLARTTIAALHHNPFAQNVELCCSCHFQYTLYWRHIARHDGTAHPSHVPDSCGEALSEQNRSHLRSRSLHLLAVLRARPATLSSHRQPRDPPRRCRCVFESQLPSFTGSLLWRGPSWRNPASVEHSSLSSRHSLHFESQPGQDAVPGT